MPNGLIQTEERALDAAQGLLPAWSHRLHVGPLELWQVIGLGVAMLVSVLLGRVVQALALRVGRRIAKRTASLADDELLASLNGPLWVLAAGFFLRGAVRGLELPKETTRLTDVITNSVAIFSIVWLLQRSLRFILAIIGERSDTRTDSEGRSIRTHLEVTGRIAQIGIWFVGGSLFLLQFEFVRSVGMSLLASAGIAGVVLGFAAQRSIAQLFAGIQLSMTQPVRLGDLIVIDKEQGEIEEIRLTYVVVRTWDGRRLVVPIMKLLDSTFENWSLGSLEQIATVALKLDFSVDLGVLRERFETLLKSEPVAALWDAKRQSVKVIDSDHATVTVRFAASVADSAKAFELSCLIRESMIAFIRTQPTWLVRGRTEAYAPTEAPPQDP
jgi:small-conductance mechanosensitive channel